MINVFMLDIKKTNVLIDLEFFEPNKCIGFWVLWNRVVTEKVL